MSYTRKQAGVIYRAVKEGRISMDKASVSCMYDFAGERVSNPRTEKMYYAIVNAVTFIFEGNYESAQVSIDNFCEA